MTQISGMLHFFIIRKKFLFQRFQIMFFLTGRDHMYQTMSYENQLEMKERQVRELLDGALNGTEYQWEGIHGSPIEFAYRNKMEFSFGDAYKDGPLTLGLHKKGSTYDVLTANDCKLVHEDMTKILTCVHEYFLKRNVSYYKKMQHTGYLRHLLLRRGVTTA